MARPHDISWYKWDGDRLILTLRVQPNAKKDEVCGQVCTDQENFIKIRITALPVEGKANKHLIKYLASLFKVPKSAIELLSGENARLKRVSIRSPKQLIPGIQGQ